MKQQSTMQHNFAKAPSINIPRSSFNRSHGHKLTYDDAGDLVPILCDEVLPGDSFSCNLSMFARLSTPIFPIMDNIFCETFFFFVPDRLIWDNFQKMQGEQDDPGDSIDFLTPVITTPPGGFVEGGLHDHMGVPTKLPIGNVTNKWARAYNLAYNTWFRDQNLQDSVTVDKGDGPDDIANYVILKRNKRFDYFTGCLPTPQRGTAVTLPLGTSADIHHNAGDGASINVFSDVHDAFRQMDTTDATLEAINVAGPSADKLYADLTTASSATVAQFREAMQIQALLELDMRGGTRYTEIVRNHFGVTSPDSRLQRPEYLGGGSQPMNMQQIVQNSANTSQPSALGQVGGVGTLHFSGHGFNKSFTEHGVIIGLMSIRADLNYQQGLDKMFSRRARLDYYEPKLANIGEQAVLSKEIFADGGANDESVFGYQERYSEYKQKNSIVTGQFRSNAATTLDAWHLTQDFGSRPVLDDAFIKDNPPIFRILAVPSEPHFLVDCYFKYICARPMPAFNDPSIAPRF